MSQSVLAAVSKISNKFISVCLISFKPVPRNSIFDILEVINNLLTPKASSFLSLLMQMCDIYLICNHLLTTCIL